MGKGFFASLSLAVAASALMAASAFADDVKIGVLTDLMGPAADIGKGSVAAAEIAIEEFGGKVGDRKIVFVSADTGNKADQASSIARKWFEVDKVDAIFDLGLTNTALAVLPIAAEQNKLAVAVSPAGTTITNEACTPTSIHWMYDTYALSAGTAKVLIDKGLKDWFFVTTDYSFGQALEKDASEFIERNGGKVVGSVKHPFNAPDMSGSMLSAAQSKSQVIALANSNNDTVNAIKAGKEYGISPTKSVAPLVVYLNTVHGMGLDLAQGLYVTEGWYWDMDDRSRKFAEKFKAKTGQMPGSLPAGTYSAVLNYLKGVEKTGSKDTGKVMEYLRTTPIDDAVIRNGKLRPDGRLAHDMYVFEVKKPGESKQAYDYYKTVGVVPGDQAFKPLELSKCALVKK